MVDLSSSLWDSLPGRVFPGYHLNTLPQESWDVSADVAQAAQSPSWWSEGNPCLVHRSRHWPISTPAVVAWPETWCYSELDLNWITEYTGSTVIRIGSEYTESPILNPILGSAILAMQTATWWLPSGKLYNVTMERSTMLLMGKITISMAMFNSNYVKLPEGTFLCSKSLPRS